MRTELRTMMAAACVSTPLWLLGCESPTQSAIARSPGPVAVDAPKVKNLNRDTDVWIGGQAEDGALKDLRARGVRTVIDLRQEKQKKDNEQQAASELDMTYTAVPMSSNGLTDEQAKKFLAAMKDRRGGVLIHCSSGNRAAGMYGLWLGMEEGVSPEAAIARARKAGLANQDLMQSIQHYIELHANEPMKPRESR
jgi:uncharacterized protein (TIGR01244 family)